MIKEVEAEDETIERWSKNSDQYVYEYSEKGGTFNHYR
jgi:hypothetical protein